MREAIKYHEYNAGTIKIIITNNNNNVMTEPAPPQPKPSLTSWGGSRE